MLVSLLSLLISLHATPLVSQLYPKGRTSDWQGDKRCGPASMAMVARAFHRDAKLNDAQLIEALDLADDGQENQATTPGGIVRMAGTLHLRARIHPGFDGAWVRRVLRRGGLVIALGRPRFLPPTDAHTGGHFVTVVGVTKGGRYVINDSYRRQGRGGRRYSVKEATLASFVDMKPNGTLFAIDASRPKFGMIARR